MKRARLPDGQIFEFPPETDEAVIDAVVRQALAGQGGEQEEEEPKEPDATLLLVVQMAETMQSIQQLLMVLAQKDDSENYMRLSAELKASTQAIVKALMAPKTVIRDDEGRPVAVKVGK